MSKHSQRVVVRISCAISVSRTLAIIGLMLAMASAAFGQYTPVYGGPTYDAPTGTGYTGFDFSAGSINDAGLAAARTQRFVSGGDKGLRPICWQPGSPVTYLACFGTDADGVAQSRAYAVNTAGVIVGSVAKYVNSTSEGTRAVRWEAGSLSATELDSLGFSAGGSAYAGAFATNSGGTAAGSSLKYVSGSSVGERAVRWEPGGTAAVELGVIGTSGSGYTVASASAINSAGTAVGYAQKYLSGSYLGSRAVRWNAGGTAATELGHLNSDPNGYTSASATAVNDAGTAVGYAFKQVGASSLGNRAVRWDAGTTGATELGNLGTDANGYSDAKAAAVNGAGTIVGYAEKYVAGVDKGPRAVRWNAGSTAATELGNLGTDAGGGANGISSGGTAVGSVYVSGLGQRAVLWGAGGVAVDLNSLVDPASGWILNSISTVSPNGRWAAGIGSYDPDGPGPLGAYNRLWIMQASHSGDATRDNLVNVDDLGVLASNYDSPGTAVWEGGDFTGDGIVNVDDLGILASNYDWVGPGGQNLPEPTGLIVLSAAGALLVRCRRVA